ncbi:helix-turn-helix domain-containing protein [Microbacterium azadirachtae]|uniref:helix-turn-helix domain-containing protein n=1 Tax=Microbacterium azadirachtae TaxID=582680 RepID=UPI0021D48966|nr:helix-turn-helix domain-containing protein [Microbacterium azadirachtae]UXW85107.1 helix-turn-helix domain-containing protein [Microbacterium azadirachtae]
MAAGVKTPPEVEAQVVELARSGKSRRQVKETTGLAVSTITRIVREAGVEWGRNGSGSNGTPETMAKARGVQSQYARNRRAAISERILDETERTLDLMSKCLVPRDRALLAQTLSHSGKAYSDLTQADMNAAPDMTGVQSMLGMLMIQMQSRPRPGNQREEVQPDGSMITYIDDQAVIYE